MVQPMEVAIVVLDREGRAVSDEIAALDRTVVRCRCTGLNLPPDRLPVPAAGLVNTALDAVTADVAVVLQTRSMPVRGWLKVLVDRLITDHRLTAIGLTASPDSGATLGLPAAAFAVRMSAWQHCGGLATDLTYDAAVLDLGWRLNLFGYSTATAANTLRDEELASDRVADLLAALYRNLGSAVLSPALSAVIADLVQLPAVDTSALDLQRSPGGDDVASITLPAESLAGPFAVDGWLSQIDTHTKWRNAVQSRRRVPDWALRELIEELFKTYSPQSQTEFLTGLIGAIPTPQVNVVEPSGLGLAPQRVDQLLELVSGLTEWWEVKLVAADRKVTTTPAANDSAEDLERSDVLVVPLDVEDSITLPKDGLLIVDVPDSLMDLLTGEQMRSALLKRADYLVCRSEDAEHLLLGALASLHRVTPALYDEDPALSTLIGRTYGKNAATATELVSSFLKHPRRAIDLVGGTTPIDPLGERVTQPTRKKRIRQAVAEARSALGRAR